MQATCSQCSQKIAIDDAKVPDRPFNVKCPKCQNVMKLPGKTASVAAPVAAAPAPPPPAPEAPREEPPPPAAAPAAVPAAAPPTAVAGGGALPGERALVALSDRGQQATITAVLERLGYPVDPVQDGTDAGRLLEQGVYAVVVTSRGFSAQGGQTETLYQRITRLSPENRRRVFAALVGDEFRTGDGTQAWVILADLVLNTKELANAENPLRGTLAERRRMYQVFFESRERFEATAS